MSPYTHPHKPPDHATSSPPARSGPDLTSNPQPASSSIHALVQHTLIYERTPKMSLFEKLGYGKDDRFLLRLVLIQWIATLLFLFAPLFSAHVNRWLTLLCTDAATISYSPSVFIITPIFTLALAFLLFNNFRQVRSGRFDDDPYARNFLPPGQPPSPAYQAARERSRRQQYVWTLTSTVLLSTAILYYGVFTFFIFVTRHHINVIKGPCTNLDFRFFEKIFIGHFLKDLPFSLGDLVSLYGPCTPNPEIFPVRLFTSLSSILHWFLILLIVGLIWGKQIKTWLFPETKTTASSIEPVEPKGM